MPELETLDALTPFGTKLGAYLQPMRTLLLYAEQVESSSKSLCPISFRSSERS